MKKLLLVSLIASTFIFSNARAEAIAPTAAKSFAKLMKVAINAKDAPAACWYLGLSEGYLSAMKNLGNSKASKLIGDLKNKEGKCGGKNSMDLKSTITEDEWSRLLEVQKKIESFEL